MINIEDKTYQPSFEEIKALINNKAFDDLDQSFTTKYKCAKTIQYSGEKAFMGWNLRYKKSSKSLCTIYPRDGFFLILVVIGPNEKQRVTDQFEHYSESFKTSYGKTNDFMGQRWLMLTIKEACPLLEDIKSIVNLRLTKA